MVDQYGLDGIDFDDEYAEYGTWAPPEIEGMGKEKLAAAAVDVAQTDLPTISELAQRTVDEDYGVFLTYNLSDEDASEQLTAFTDKLYGRAAERHGDAPSR